MNTDDFINNFQRSLKILLYVDCVKRSHAGKGTSDLAGLLKNHQMMKKLGINGVFCLFKVLGIQSLSSAVRPCCVVILSLGNGQKESAFMKDCPHYLIIVFYWNTHWEPLWRREVYVTGKNNYIHVKIF